MASLNITLHNPQGLRLVVGCRADQRNTCTEHELRSWVAAQTNADPDHGKYGPWEAVCAVWTS